MRILNTKRQQAVALSYSKIVSKRNTDLKTSGARVIREVAKTQLDPECTDATS